MNRIKYVVTKYYLYFVLDLIILGATYGFSVPTLISSDNMTLNIIGAVVAVLLPLGLYWLNRPLIKEIRALHDKAFHK